MSQYKTGTVTATPGSPIIAGASTAFLGNVQPGSFFSVRGSGVPFIIASVDTNGQITLAANYAGTAPYTGAGLQYEIQTSFTTNHGLAYPELGDLDTATTMKRMAQQLDVKLGNGWGSPSQASRVVFTDANGNLSTSANAGYSDGGTLALTKSTAGDGLTVTNGGATPKKAFIYSSAATVGFFDGANTTGNGLFIDSANTAVYLQANGALQLKAVGNASTTRWLTAAGSNGGNPALGVSGGNLNITANVVMSGYMDLGTNNTALYAADGSASGPSITFNNDADTGFYRVGANILAIATGGAKKVQVLTAGDGSNWINLYGAADGGACIIEAAGGSATNSAALALYSRGTGAITFQTDGGGSGVTQMIINHTASAARSVTVTGAVAGGAPAIGTTAGSLNVNPGGLTALNLGAQAAAVNFFAITATATGGHPLLAATGSDTDVNMDLTPKGGGSTRFWKNGAATNVGLFNGSGYFKGSNSGTYNSVSGAFHELLTDGNGSALPILRMQHGAATATNQNGIQIYLTGDPNNTTNFGLQLIGNATERFTIRANGGKAGFSANDVNLSDARAKVNLVPAPSYWDYIERVSRTLKRGSYADDQSGKAHTMLVAQELEAIDDEVITPWRASPLVEFKGVTEHEIQMRMLGVVGELQRRVQALESRR